jgi:hypothetical protein
LEEPFMKTRLTIEQLEQMKTHELADLLSNVVLLLRRMPDVACSQLIQHLPTLEDHPQAELPQWPMSDKPFTEDELRKKTVPELKEIARGLNVTTSGKKDDLVRKILARSVSGRSEQFAIQDV